MSVEIRYCGGLGNNLFQYTFARLLADTLGRELVSSSGPDAEIGRYALRFADAAQTRPGQVIHHPQLRYTKRDRPLWDEHGVDLEHLLREGADKRIVLHGYFQRSEFYLPERDRIRQWFAPRPPVRQVADISPADVIVHIRRGDYFRFGSVLGLRYYQHVLDILQPRRVFVTGVGIDEETRRALARYEPHWLNDDAVTAMWTLAQFDRIVAANSTFSWWGAFLSRASTVYFPRPVSGLWSRETSRIALEIHEPGFHYVDNVEIEPLRGFSRV